MEAEKSCPVVLRGRETLEILAFEHPFLNLGNFDPRLKIHKKGLYVFRTSRMGRLHLGLADYCWRILGIS